MADHPAAYGALATAGLTASLTDRAAPAPYDRGMDVAHVVLLVLHVGGVVAVLVGLLVQVRRPVKVVNGLVRDGIGTAFLAGLFLVGVLEAGDDPVDHTKIAVKFGIGLVILVLVMANLRKPKLPEGLFYGIFALTVLNIAIAVFWSPVHR